MEQSESGSGIGFAMEIGQRPSKPLHEHWGDALRQAADSLAPGEADWFNVQTWVYVKHSSPGWVDGFKVQLTKGG
jgi:hypothetical protein